MKINTIYLPSLFILSFVTNFTYTNPTTLIPIIKKQQHIIVNAFKNYQQNLHNRSSSSTKQSSINQLLKIIVTHPRNYYSQKDLIREFLTRFYAEQTSTKYARLILLLLTTIALEQSNTLFAELFDILDTIKKASDYWTNQKHYPYWYALHKPASVFFKYGFGVKDAILHKQKLTKLYNHYTEYVGSLSRHIHIFNINLQNNEIETWLNELISLFDRIHQIKSAPIAPGAFVDLFDKLSSFALYHEDAESRFVTTHRKHLIPSHFEKNWLRYALIIAGCTYACKLPMQATAPLALLHTLYEASLKAKDAVAAHIIEPCINTFNVAFGYKPITLPRSTIPQKNDSDNLNIEPNGLEQAVTYLDEKMQQAQEVLTRVHDTEAPDPEFFEKEMVRCRELLAKVARTELPQLSNAERNERIEEALRTGNIGALGINVIEKKNTYYTNELNSKLGAAAAAKEYWIIKFLDDLIEYSKKKGLTTTIEVLRLFRNIANDFGHKLKKLDLTLQIVCLTPAFLTFKLATDGVKSGYHWWYDVDFSKLQQGMCRLEKILVKNSNVAILSDRVYGIILHELHELRRIAQFIIPKKDGNRDSFFKDLEDLTSDFYTTNQKEKLITIMRERYKFL